MKNMKKLFLGVVGISLMTLFTNCEKANDENTPAARSASSSFSGGGPVDCPSVVKTFYAGQHINSGTITTLNDGTNLFIVCEMKDNWVMGMTHIYAGAFDNMPKSKSGNPKIGNFPYKVAHDPMTNLYVFSIPLTDLNLDCFSIAVHSEVHHLNSNGEVDQSETAWADGEQITKKGSWAMYYDYCICIPQEEEEED